MKVATPVGDVVNEGPVRASYRNATVEVAAARLAGAGSWIEAQGSLPGTLRYQGRFDLAALLNGRQTGLTGSGTAQLDGSVEGTIEKLSPSASSGTGRDTSATSLGRGSPRGRATR